jgi:hypothetical protein
VTFSFFLDDIGCSTQAFLFIPITVYEVPKANFSNSPDEITIANPEVQFSHKQEITKWY